MTKIQTVAPTELAVDLAAARANMRIDGDHMDGLLTLWLKGIIMVLEHEIDQCIMEQTWAVRLDVFPGISPWSVGGTDSGRVSAAIALPHPVLAVTSVKYLDIAGVEQTLAPSAYKLVVQRYQSYLIPKLGTRWPATANEADAVVVSVQCGYGSTSASTPENVQLYILAKLVEQFDPATRLERDTVQSVFIDRLLDACRSYV
ncbi:head-tail connector protein [Janthinobacterium fluminis]|uniref:PhiE125 gp8 family phage protein n=1 Tax=Janthinobacterium fluminis TaxID=2987524 RepID=A0ABT5JU50_9BURK|nr:hypothetical protein [Janthinobacterium fluminis]MDC8756257.1 hypothetical protein [Janthinobacterium fluminis]